MKITRRKLIANVGITGGAMLGSRLFPTGVGNLLNTALGDVPTTTPSTQTRWETIAQRKNAIAKDIVWLSHEPPQFLLRRGEHADDVARQYQRMLDPDNLQRMADAGVIWGRLFFYKGFGLEYERHNMELAHQAADIMHKLGMKVSLYFGGTMFAETLYKELPEAQGWEQRDQNNQWVPYGAQTFRHYACPNEPAYREYLKRILAIGINEIHADEIAFDNIMLQPEPKSCRCPRCTKAFAEFLRKRYPTKEAVERRFGLPDVDSIHVNEWGSADEPGLLSDLNDPVLQEWTRFRCQSLATYANDLYDMTKALNPDVSVLMNIKGVFSYNRYWTNAVYHPMYADKIDGLSFDTNGYEEQIDDATGALISQIRSYKMARRINSSVEDALNDELRAAVHMAFGIQKPQVRGFTATPFGTGAQATFNATMEFFREYNNRYYTETENVADVAILHNWPSMAYSINATYVPVTLMEQVLIQYKIPFDLLFDEQLERIDRYSAVILAGQECVSDSQARILIQYAQNGGTLVITGNTGEFNHWREKRTEPNPFLPERAEGKGRIVFIPEITQAQVKLSKSQSDQGNPEPGGLPQRGPARMSPPQWVLPRNHKEIYTKIVNALPSGLSITTAAPLTTVVELLTRPRTRETIAHFVNFDRDNDLDPFAVSIKKQFAGPIKSVALLSPATNDPVPVDFKESGDKVSFTVPAMGLYSMLVIAQ